MEYLGNPQPYQKVLNQLFFMALSRGEIACRLGAFIAPVCGTLPAALSCKVFGALCLAAAWATWADPARERLQVEAAESADSDISFLKLEKRLPTQPALEPMNLSRV